MKQKIERTNTSTKRFSVRTIAMVLSIVMLIGSIATGSMLSTFAAYLKDAAKSDAVSQAATEGGDIALNAIPSEDNAAQQDDEAAKAEALSDFEENAIVQRIKKDFAETGAAVDLADIGYSTVYLYYTTASSGKWNTASVKEFTANNSGSTTLTLSANTTYRFIIASDKSNGNWWGNNTFDLSKQTTKTNNLGSYYNFYETGNDISLNPNTLKTSTAGTYTFSVNLDTTSCTVSGGDGGSGGGSTGSTTYVVTGDNALTGTSGWSNTSSNNEMTFDSTAKVYKKSYTVSYTTGTFNFRIVPSGTWDKTWGYNRANKVDTSGIVTTWQSQSGSSDNNIQMQLSQPANIEIVFDDSKSDTSAITVIVNPTSSVVTTAVSPTDSGTATVGGKSSATVAYGDTVTLSASPTADYLFSSWSSSSDKVSIASATQASTSATVTGAATVTANFVKKSYTVSKGTGTGFTITTPTSNQSKQWGTSVSVAAKTSSDLYYIDYLYYVNAGETSENVISGGKAAGAGTYTTLSGSFSMPKNNVTVYAHVHEKTSSTINYGVTSDSPSGSGYVSVGKAHNTSASAYSKTQIDYTIDSGSKVIEGTYVNFGARAAAHYKFLGWYPNADGSGTQISSLKDYQKQTPSGGYYAKFAAETPATVDPRDPETGKIKLFIDTTYCSNFNYVTYWGDSSGNASITKTSTVTMNSDTCYMVTINTTGTIGALLRANTSDYNTKTQDINNMVSGTNYYITFRDNNQNNAYWAEPSYTSTTAPADGETTTYYPAKLYVTNSDLGYVNSSTKVSGTYLSNYFCARSSSVNVNARPTDTDNMKSSIRKVSGATDTTSVIKYPTTASTMTMNASATSATATVTFIPKEYYKVNFSASAGGTITATAGGTSIKSGTSIKEGTAISFSATPASGYSVAGWTGDVTNSTAATNSISAANFTSDKTVRVYFSKSKGTSNTGTKFGYGTDNNPSTWTIINTYVDNGRVYAYIDGLSAATTYYFQAYQAKSSYSTEEKYTYQYYRNNENSWADTNFNPDVYDINKYKRGNDYNASCNEIQFKVTSKVSGVKIDLGPVKSGTTGEADPYSEKNTYHIIPIYNTDVNKVTVYAKDGTFRDDPVYDYTPSIADTVISNPTGGGVTNISSHTEFETAVAEKGKAITVTTTIDAGAYNRDRFYVKGFSFNGVTPELLEPNDSGEYTCTYTIPADFEDDYLEITPIYFIKDSYLNTAANKTSAITFYIENYDEALQNTGWGNTLAVYPYYSIGTSPVYSKANVFGGYPGLPVVNYGGRRYVQVPTTYKIAFDNESGSAYSVGDVATIKGITLSNYYWDKVHRDYCREVDTHLQTYDFDDFYKIYHETTIGHEVNGKETVADQITFVFKYRDKIDNFGATTRITAGDTIPATIDPDNFSNGWEPLLDYHDRPINIFGKQLSNAEQANDPIYVVSNGYEYTHAGNYATTYTAYYNDNGTYRKITTITPSALIITDQDDVADYPDAPQVTGGPALLQISQQTDEYEALMDYSDRPVQITYEKAILNSNTSGEGKYYHSALGELSTRSDGRWFYSYMNEEINANLRIDYTNEYTGEETTKWTSDTYRSGTNTGSVTGATVHFTNDGTTPATDGGYVLTDYHDTADWTALDPTHNIIYSNFNHYYKFAATEGSGYIFQGWYMERDGKCTAVNADDIKKLAGQSQMTSSATFVARYVKNPAGHITIKHLMADGSTGTGTTYIGIEKSTDGTTWENVSGTSSDKFVRADSFSINDTDIMSYGSGYTLRVTLKTVVESDTKFDRFSASEAEGDHSSEYFSTNVSTESTTSTTQFEIPVDDLFTLNETTGIPAQKEGYDTFTYYSHTTRKPELTISHNRDATSAARAEGEFYLKVEVLDASGDPQATYGGDYSKTIDNNVVVSDLAKGKDLTVPSDYFYGGTNGRKLRVTLVTDMLGFTQFDKFSIFGEDLGNHATASGQSVNISDQNSMRTKMAVITFPIKDLFDGDTPRVTELPYLSRLILPEYKYEIKYTYPAYTDKAPVSYTAKDVFAQEDLNAFMNLTSNDLAFKTNDDKKTFACSKAPYEDNFQKILDWSKATFGNRSYDANTYTLTLQVTITEAEQQRLNVQFNLPYDTDIDNGNNYEPVVNNGKIIKKDPQKITSNKETYGRDWFVISGRRNPEVSGNDPEYVKAPLIIYDEDKDQNYYFKYWSVETEGTAKYASREYTRCYDYEFNLSIYQDCVITPLYDTIPFESRSMATPVPATYNDYGRFDPDVNREYYKLEANGVSITFIENSRNQYNNDDGGNAAANRHGAADRIYSDFLLTYDYDPKTILSKEYSRGGVKQAGMILQPVGYLNLEDGEYVVEDEDTYATQYPGFTPEQIKTKIESGDFSKVIKSQFDVKELDNKNRMQYYYGIDNAAVKASGATADDDGIIRVGNMNNNHKLVFKAFAYIGDGNGTGNLTNVIVSPQPVYFTIYTDATIQPGYYPRP